MIKGYPWDTGFFMPAEYSSHSATIMIYPVREGSWGTNPERAREAFGNIIREIAKDERVYLIASEEYAEQARNLAKGSAELICIDTDDAWARDTAPTFVVRGGDVRGISWKFNAWGGEFDGLYTDYSNDDALAEKLCAALGFPCYDAGDFVLEGGSVHSDGEGTVMTTEECLLSRGRNPSLTRDDISDRLRRFLGAEKVLWLPCGIYNDETNGHVDNICAFIAPSEVVLAWCEDENDPQYERSAACYEYLSMQTDAKGRKLTVHKLPIPRYPVCFSEKDCRGYSFAEGESVRVPGERLAASYVNFYFTSSSVLVPQFGGENTESDGIAVEILTKICRGRRIVPIAAADILKGGGNIHCITQQIPKGVFN